MPSRSMVSRAARAFGVTTKPCASSSINVWVAIASISGTISAGISWVITLFKAAPSSMSITCERCATCMAGALA